MTEEQRKELNKGLHLSTFPLVKGGQQWNNPAVVRLTHKELGFEVEISYHCSVSQNVEHCMLMFNLFLNTLNI